MPPSNPSIEPCYTVSQLTRQIKTLLEGSFGLVRLRGEISNLRRQASGHIYFSVKDASASISGVCFRGDAARLKVQLRDGMQIAGVGHLSVYEPRGNYQVIFRNIEEDGIGRLQQAFLELKEKLSAEGLFDSSRKKALPDLPRTIGFVTSESGAALRDFVSILRRRDWRGRLVVIPARVQGKEAAPEIVAGIDIANREQLCDLLVIGRGGGSLEDLWPFNEEIVARAVANSRIPVISAVGHEIDFTLSDFAADFRAETPSAAAERITSSFVAYTEKLETLSDRLGGSIDYSVEQLSHRLALVMANFRNQHPERRLEQAVLRLDDLQARLGQSLGTLLREQRQKLALANSHFSALRPEQSLLHAREKLRQVKLRLVNNSHQAALNRGYAMLRTPGGEVLSDAKVLPEGSDFLVELRDGSFPAHRK